MTLAVTPAVTVLTLLLISGSQYHSVGVTGNVSLLLSSVEECLVTVSVECDDEIKIAAVCLLLLSLGFLPEVSCPLSSAAAAGGRRVISSAARQVTVTTLGGDWLCVTVLHCR